MSDDATTEDNESGDVDGTDNTVIRELRNQLKEAKAELKKRDPSVIREQVLSEVNRENQAATLMEKAGFPKLSKLFANEVEGDLDAEKATEFLGSLGLTTEEGNEGNSQDDAASQVAGVADLGQSLQSTVAGVKGDPETVLKQRFATAGEGKSYQQVLAELQGIADEAGIGQS